MFFLFYNLIISKKIANIVYFNQAYTIYICTLVKVVSEE
jgi:hypothetical protein